MFPIPSEPVILNILMCYSLNEQHKKMTVPLSCYSGGTETCGGLLGRTSGSLFVGM